MSFGEIQLTTAELELIKEKLIEKQFTGSDFKIIDTGTEFTIRDNGDHLIGFVKKSIKE